MSTGFYCLTTKILQCFKYEPALPLCYHYCQLPATVIYNIPPVAYNVYTLSQEGSNYAYNRSYIIFEVMFSHSTMNPISWWSILSVHVTDLFPQAESNVNSNCTINFIKESRLITESTQCDVPSSLHTSCRISTSGVELVGQCAQQPLFLQVHFEHITHPHSLFIRAELVCRQSSMCPPHSGG